MKVPKYVEDIIWARCHAAERYIVYCCKLSEFLHKHNIEIEDYDDVVGCETLCNPRDSASRVLSAIRAKEK